MPDAAGIVSTVELSLERYRVDSTVTAFVGIAIEKVSDRGVVEARVKVGAGEVAATMDNVLILAEKPDSTEFK